jgi:signal transduction histidine kinase/ligand-binding sensor domain-containing protein
VYELQCKRKLDLACGVMLLSLALMAQGSPTVESTPLLRNEVLSTWTTEQGLPQNFVTSIAQTPDGFLWIGTLNGLARFDGLHFETFEKNAPPELQENILKLSRDNQDGIWIVTITKLFHYTHGHFLAIAIPGTPHARVDSLTRAGDGGVLILSENQMMRSRGDTLHQENLPADLHSPRCIFEGENGTLWIADNEHIWAQQPDHSIVRYDQPATQILYGDHFGNIYAGDGHKLFHLEGARFKLVPHPGLGNFVDIMVDHRGALWMASGGLHGLSRRQGAQTESLTTADGLASNDVRIIFEDANKDVWVGTIAGLQRFHRGIFTTYPLGHNPIGGRIQADAVFAQRNGAVWAGTLEGGVVEYWKGSSISFGRAQGLPPGQVRGFAEHGPSPAIAISDYGIFERHGNRFAKIPSIPNGYVNTPVGTSDGSLWFSVLRRGLFRLNDGKLSSIDVGKPKPGKSTQSILYLGTDKQRELWVGDGPQLEHWTGDHLERVVTTTQPIISVAWPGHGLAVATIRGLVLWLASSREQKFTGEGRTITKDQGLPASFVLDVLSDANDNLWVVTSRGIALIDKAQWTAFAAGKLERIVPEIFDEADGLKSTNILPLNQVTAATSPDGHLWFATVAGLAVENPHQPDPMAQAVIDYVQVDDQRLSPETTIIAPGRHRLRFAYTAPTNTAPEQIRFRYRLANWDRNWIEAGMERSVSYTGLPPGNYTFQVVASNREGASSGVAATRTLTLQPFFWQNEWFLVLVILAIAASVIEFTRRRTKRRAERLSLRFQERAAERERLAYQIHDTVIQDMIGVAFQLELLGFQLTDKPESATDSLGNLAGRVRGSIARNRNMVASLHSTASKESSLIDVLRNAEAEFRVNELPEFELTSVGEPRPIDPLVRDEVYRICREALSNAFRHSYAKHVRVKIQFLPNSFEVSLTDDGQGIDEVIMQRGRDGHFGLRGMQANAKRIGAVLSIESQPGQGTRIALHVRTNRPAWKNWRTGRKQEEESFASDERGC